MSGRAVGDEEMRRIRIRTNDLADDLVQKTLAGFLHQELRNVHGVSVSHADIHKALTAYVQAVGLILDVAADIFAGNVPK
jgi:hypothetical protein